VSLRLRRYPPITTLSENEQFCEFLQEMLDEQFSAFQRSRYNHLTSFSATVIPSLSLGLSLSSPYLPPDELDSFMRRMLVSRISRRVLVEHHIALSEVHAGKQSETSDEPHVGIIFTGLNVRRSIEKCSKLLREKPVWKDDHCGNGNDRTKWPDVVVDGHLETKFSYIREHLECVSFSQNPLLS
jgi:pyruvate dehydrogenase kinase 2/3/4